MNHSHQLSHVASLLGDPARAIILTTLMSGYLHTAGELAGKANISAQSASNHLKKLLEARLVTCIADSKFRYYQLSSFEVAEVIESLIRLPALIDKNDISTVTANKQFSNARSCYDHLAGKLGVKLVTLLVRGNYLELNDKQFDTTSKGLMLFSAIGIDIQELKQNKRQFAKACMDCSEKQYHIAGSLGKALLNYFLDQHLVIRIDKNKRILVLTQKGNLWLNRLEIGDIPI